MILPNFTIKKEGLLAGFREITKKNSTETAIRGIYVLKSRQKQGGGAELEVSEDKYFTDDSNFQKVAIATVHNRTLYMNQDGSLSL